MRKKKRRFHHAEHPKSMPDFFEEDKDQKFYLGRLATYLHRVLTVRPILDSEIIDILCQLMPEKAQDLAHHSRRVMRGTGMKDDEEEEYNEAETGRVEEMADRLSGLTNLNANQTSKLIKQVLRLLERKREELRYPGLSRIEKKMAALSKMFSLTRQEQEVCYFLFINSTYQPADHFFVDHLQCHTPLGRKHLSAILDMRAGEIDNALGGTLQRIDMVEMGRVYFQLRESFVDYFIKASGPDLHKNFFTLLARKTIPLNCHFVDKDEAEHVLKLLKDKNETPTHILLYGAAGTGKTSFARGIARRLKIPAYEIAREDDNTSLKRRAAIVACLNMTNKGAGSLIVADEADNILNTDGAWLRRGETQDKGWLNGLLEVPGVRMIWITNTTDGIEPSVLRRFAYSIPFNPSTADSATGSGSRSCDRTR